MIGDATKNLEAKIDSMKESMNAQFGAQRTMMTLMGFVLGIIGLAIAAGPIVAKFIP